LIAVSENGFDYLYELSDNAKYGFEGKQICGDKATVRVE